MEFAHSIVLFCGDDGLSLEFNIQNTVEKTSLKALIEHGGGLCTLSDDAIFLVSPGKRVINVRSNKTLLSSRYIFDCVERNFLLDMNEYRVEINEMEISDISDNSANLIESGPCQIQPKSSDDAVENSIDIIEPDKVLPSNVLCTNSDSDHLFDSQENDNQNNIVVINKEIEPGGSPLDIPLQSHETHIKIAETSVAAGVPDSLGSDELDNAGQNLLDNQVRETEANLGTLNDGNGNAIANIRDSPSPVDDVIVSSSQPNDADQFDDIILNKINEKPAQKDDDEDSSQSYTVSSSADAQVSSPKPPSHHTSAEIFDGSSAAPDSASQTTERQQYIRNLEKEVEQILQKPSPKSIQDKIILVKYICCVKKLAPAIVLQTLQNYF